MDILETKAAVAAYMSIDVPVFLWGAPGIGKTALINEIGRDTGRTVIDWRANLREPVDARGLPTIDKKTMSTAWARPNDLPFVGSDLPEDSIVFLDELNTAAPSMMVVGMQLVHERRVGEHRLKDRVQIIAAGNRQSDRAAVQKMPAPLANRFAHIDVEVSPDAFCKWGAKVDINPMVLAFIRFRPNLLHDMNGADQRAFPTPRAWEKVAKIADLNHAMRLALVTGLVGPAAAAEFEGFIRLYSRLPSIESILKDPDGAPVPTDQEPAARYAVAAGLSRKATVQNFAAVVTYCRRLPREFEVLAVVDAVRRDPALCDTAAFVQWASRNADVVI